MVRHGETAWNHEGRMQGQTDVDLSDFGREQARRLGVRLAREPLGAVYSSDLRRCWDTATIALAGRDVPMEPVVGLREVHLGSWQGYTNAELRNRFPDELRRVRADPEKEAAPGGENRAQLRARIVAAIEAIVARHPDDQVLVVSHGGALRALACWLLMADLRAYQRIDLDNCGLCRIDFDRDGPTLRRWNDVSHLDGLIDPRTRDARVE